MHCSTVEYFWRVAPNFDNITDELVLVCMDEEKLESEVRYEDGDKINPIEVKSGNYRGHKSFDVFCEKFNHRIKDKYVVHTKDYKWKNGIHYLPVYMIPFL